MLALRWLAALDRLLPPPDQGDHSWARLPASAVHKVQALLTGAQILNHTLF